MNQHERNAVKLIAKSTPWLAPFPSAYFVARSAMANLAVPFFVAVVIAAIVETLGVASVHTWLWLSDWNVTKLKSDPYAPATMTIVLGIIYLVTTIGLTVILEVEPSLSTYAPALFPILAVVGAVNLALIAQQEQRESESERKKQERRDARKERVQSVQPVQTVQKDSKEFKWVCWCGYDKVKKRQGKASHMRKHANEVRKAATALEGLRRLKELYPHAWTNGAEPVKIQEVVKWRETRKEKVV